jgi:hypothetical protein
MAEPPIPTSVPSTAKARALDLALLEEDARRYLTRDRPATDALWKALLRPRDAVLREWHYQLGRAKQIAEGLDAGLVDPLGATLGSGPAAIEAVATATVARAMLGDQTCAQEIYMRIEGAPSKRKMDESEAGQARAEMIQGIEAIVRQMNRRPGDAALDVTPTPEPPAAPAQPPDPDHTTG